MIGVWKLQDCVQHIAHNQPAALYGDNSDIHEITTDSRHVTPKSLFVALEGNHHDGHLYVESAYAQGSIAALVHKHVATPLAYIRTTDTTKGLGLLAQYNRMACDGQVIGVTGSSGKTTVCAMLASIFSLAASTLATHKNYNNEIGVAHTLLRIEQHHAFAIVEMGARCAGDIDYLTGLVVPQTAIITNIGHSHLATLGGLDQVAKVKTEIFTEHLLAVTSSTKAQQHSSLRWAIVSSRDQRAYRLLEHIPKKTTGFTFGLAQEGADAALHNIQLAENYVSARLCLPALPHRPSQNIAIRLSIGGAHQLHNAAAAALTAWVHNIDEQHIIEGLAKFTPASDRGGVIRFGKHVLYNDSYNANPASVQAAIDTLVLSKPAFCVLILGDMLELGEQTQLYHRQLGEYAAAKKIDAMFTYGDLTQITGKAFMHSHQGALWISHNTYQQLADELFLLMQQHKQLAILVKGSRSMHMERIIPYIQQRDSSVSDSRYLTQ